MEGLCKWIFAVALLQTVNSECDIVFKDKVWLRVEANEDDGEQMPDELTVDVMLVAEEDPVLTFELELGENLNDTQIELSKTNTTTVIYNHTHSGSIVNVSHTLQQSYLVKGEITHGLLSWEFSPSSNTTSTVDNDSNEHHLAVTHCLAGLDNGNMTHENVGANSNDGVNSGHLANQSRRKRAVNTYTVELLMVIDNAVYSHWKHLQPDPATAADSDIVENIQQYYAYVLKEIDNRFVNMEQELFEMNIAFSGMIITKTDEESYWTTTSTVEDEGDSPRTMVNSSEALEKFQHWLDDNSTDLPQYDHAILFTGSDLIYAGNPGNTGLAFEASMCRNISNSSIVEESFDSRTTTYAVRQIARSLGIRDDMDNNDCLEFFNFIMAPKFKLPIKSFPANRWLFSTCSAQYLKEYIASLNEVGLNCLQDIDLPTRFPIELTQLVEYLPGKLYDAKEQCVNKFGKGSDICRAEMGNKYTKLCSGLMCTLPDSGECDVILPADGTPCGNMKYCLGGECAEFEDGEKRLDSCVFGNQPGEQCEVHISGSPILCYNDTLNYKCCLSCAARSTGLQHCQYGDRVPGCLEDDCAIQDETYTQSDCCLTCLDDSISFSPLLPDFITAFISMTSRAPNGNTDTTASAKSPMMSSSTQFGSSLKHAFGSSAPQETSIKPLFTTHSDRTKSLEERRNEFGNALAYTSTSTPTSTSIASAGLTHKSETPTTDNTRSASLLSTLASSVYTESPLAKTTTKEVSNKGTSNNGNDKTDDTSATSKTPNVRVTPKQDGQHIHVPAGKGPGPTHECITSKLLGRPHGEQRPYDDHTSTYATTTSMPATASYTTKARPAPRHTKRMPPVPREPTPGKPRVRDDAMLIYNRIFFKELARDMRRNQRTIRHRVQQSVKSLYASISRRIGNFQETENENEMVHAANLMSELPSNDDDDLNRQLKPIWMMQYRSLVRDLEIGIKRMRYKVLMMVNRHFRH